MMTIPTSQRCRSSLPERFWRKVEQHPTGCWPWKGGCFKHPRTRQRTYGCFWIGDKREGTGRMAPAHAVSWQLSRGPIPQGAKVLHSCDNPQCVRPDHLFLGSQADNIRDMTAKGRAWWQQEIPR